MKKKKENKIEDNDFKRISEEFDDFSTMLQKKNLEERKAYFMALSDEKKIEHIEEGIERILIVKINELKKESDYIDNEIDRIIESKECYMDLLSYKKNILDNKKKEQQKKKKKEVIEIKRTERFILGLEKVVEREIIAIDKLKERKVKIEEEIDKWIMQKQLVEEFVRIGKYILTREKYKQNKKKRKEDKDEKEKEK